MNGDIKKIKNTFPVTTTKAVYIDGTNKTLQQAIDNKELGGTVTTATTSGRGYAQIKLRGARVYVEIVEESKSIPNKIKYYFPTGDSDRMRTMYCWTPSGGHKSIQLADGELAWNDGLVYNFDTNTVEVRNRSWGNVSVANNEILLLYNDYTGNGWHYCVGGALSPYIVTNYQDQIPVRYIEAEQVSSKGNGLSQGMFVIDDKMYCWGHSSDDQATTAGGYRAYNMNNLETVVFSGSHYLGHMNAPSYSHSKDMMIVANGSKIYDQTNLPMKGWICKNFKSVIEAQPSALHYSDMDVVELDLSQFAGEFKAQLCWGAETSDTAYLMTCDNRIIRKLTLGKGTNNLGNGTFIENMSDNDYNGTFSIDDVWKTWNSDIMGGFKFYNGCLYTGVKGSYGIRKMELCTNGQIYNSYIVIDGFFGAMQGIDVKDGYMYAYTDGRGYKFSLDKL